VYPSFNSLKSHNHFSIFHFPTFPFNIPLRKFA